MQDKIQKISPFKQNILKFVDSLGISKRDFYAKTGISRGTLDNTTGITEETLVKLFATYPELSAEYVLRGKEPMLIKNNEEKALPLNNNELLDRIERLVEEKTELKARINELEKEKKYQQTTTYRNVAEP